jgi:cytochrome c-type biogenesis protein
VGITFGFAWTPCIGPVLSVILFWASQAKTVYAGIGLLTAYGIGMGVPFLIVALLFEVISPKLSKAQKFGNWLQKGSGVLIVIFGILMLLNKTHIVTFALLEIFNIDKFAV